MSTGNQKNVKGANGLMSLASKAKKPAAKKEEKENIKVTDATVAAAITTMVEEKAKMDAAETAFNMAAGVVKEHGKGVAISYAEKHGKMKDSFILSNDQNKSALFVVTDSYKRANLDEERCNYLRDTFGEDIISTENKFVINTQMLEAHPEIGNILCDFIANNADIQKIVEKYNENKAEEETLIQLEQKNVIAKGTIDRLDAIAKHANTTVEAVFNEVQPTCQLKVRGK